MTAGVAADAFALTEIAIRGREEPMIVRTAKDPSAFASLLERAGDRSLAEVG